MSEKKRPITVEDLYQINYVEDPQISPDGRWIAFIRITPDKMENGYKRNIWLADTDGGEPFQLTRGDKGSSPRWSPDGETLAFVSGRSDKPQIYLLPINAPGGEARSLTKMEKGATFPAWSPDGETIAFLCRMNAEEREKEDSGEDAPPSDKFEAEQRKARKKHEEEKRWDPRPVWRVPYREGTAFLDDRYQQVYVMETAENLDGDKIKARRLTDVDANHGAPEWTPDGKYIYTNRTHDLLADELYLQQRLYRIHVEDGEIEQVTHGDDISDTSPQISPDGKWVAFIRMIMPFDALERLIVKPVDGGEERTLNLEIDRAPFNFRWTADNILIANVGDQGDSVFYRIDPADGAYEQLFTDRIEAAELDVSPLGGVTFTASTPYNPQELFWLPSGASSPVQVTAFNEKFLDGVVVQEVHEMRYETPNGEIQGWYMLPVGYEEGKQYPLAFNIHGGPHAMWGPSSRTMWHEWQFHAARGYAVFFANPRGSGGYGDAFKRGLHSDWGNAAFNDLMTGIDTLLERFDFVDSERMAVTGGSYGGYMTAWIVGHTDRFASAVTQRGVYNLAAFYGVTDVPELITSEFDAEPWEDPEKLWKHSPLAYAHNIKTPLLIIHSENDYRVPIADGEQLFAFVRRSGGTVKLLRYPRDGHELSRSGEPEHRVNRLTEMVEWFDKYCKE